MVWRLADNEVDMVWGPCRSGSQWPPLLAAVNVASTCCAAGMDWPERVCAIVVLVADKVHAMSAHCGHDESGLHG